MSFVYINGNNGIIIEQNNKSETAKEVTNIVVAWTRNFALCKRAKIVSKLPEIPIKLKKHDATCTVVVIVGPVTNITLVTLLVKFFIFIAQWFLNFCKNCPIQKSVF